jgi:hypothetical protein
MCRRRHVLCLEGAVQGSKANELVWCGGADRDDASLGNPPPSGTRWGHYTICTKSYAKHDLYEILR